MTDHDRLFDPDDADLEDLTSGGSVLCDLIAAVDFVRRGDRHGLTVYDAIEEALRWWVAERVSLIDGVADPEIADLAWGDPDPLRTALARLLVTTSTDEPVHISVAIHRALRHWNQLMSSLHNDDRPWPDPPSRKRFPTPLYPDEASVVEESTPKSPS